MFAYYQRVYCFDELSNFAVGHLAQKAWTVDFLFETHPKSAPPQNSTVDHNVPLSRFCSSWGIPHFRHINISCYPLVNIQKAIENDHRNSGFSH